MSPYARNLILSFCLYASGILLICASHSTSGCILIASGSVFFVSALRHRKK